MSHCPQCGERAPLEALVCPSCGNELATQVRRPQLAHTIVGVARTDVPLPARASAMPSKLAMTMVGMPGDAPPQRPRAAPPPPAAGRTMVGMPGLALPAGLDPAQPLSDDAATIALPGRGAKAQGSNGGAQPALPRPAPPAREPDPPGYQPAEELGATMGPAAVRFKPNPLPPRNLDLEKRHRGRREMKLKPLPPAHAGKKPERAPRRGLVIAFAAGGLALAGVLFAVLWPSAPAIGGRPRADSSGKEGVELQCATCPDGTTVTIGASTATMAAGLAFVVPPEPLAIGDNRLKVAVDRPANGRDETVTVPVNVAYRIHPDLQTLQSERPAFQIVAEIGAGTAVTLDGKKMQLAGGRAVENIDVTEACTGLSSEVKTLSRQIPYSVTPASGPVEKGVVSVSVGIVPLSLEAPVPVATGSAPPHVTTDGSSFTIAGSTMKGAEVLAAGRPIPVHADGTFAQVMNVSSVGQTVIEVRAKMPGMAPRISQIRVRRVDNLEGAGKEFVASESPVPWGELAAGLAARTGKAVALSGEVTEARKQGYQTVMMLDVSAASGCPAGTTCPVRLVQSTDSSARKGDTLRVFGHVARAVALAGRGDIPEIEVDFSIRGPVAGASVYKDRK